MKKGKAGDQVRAVARSFGRAAKGVASLPEHLQILRQSLGETRRIEAEFHDSLRACLLQVETAAGASAADWLVRWEVVMRAPMRAARRLEALRLLFVKLAMARAPATPAGPGTLPGAMTIEIASGEVLDRMTILEIKLAHIKDEAKLRNVRHEHALLEQVERAALPASEKLAQLRAELKAVNQAIWDIEDRIREFERAKDFGPAFVETARSVYKTNDRRATVKRQINDFLGSAIVEEKSYAPY